MQSGDRGLKVSAAKDDEEEAHKTIKITTDALGVTPSKWILIIINILLIKSPKYFVVLLKKNFK